MGEPFPTGVASKLVLSLWEKLHGSSGRILGLMFHDLAFQGSATFPIPVDDYLVSRRESILLR